MDFDAQREQGAAFESSTELKEAHDRLLEAFDQLLERDASPQGEAAGLGELEPQIQSFLERGSATGLFLEDVKERTACQVLLQYWASSLSGSGREVPGPRLASFDGGRLPDLKDKPCPYVGLEAFRTETFFFGREADTDALLEKIESTALVVVIGASGSGKSSLVMGGILPKLQEQSGGFAWRVAPTFVPGDSVIDHLAACVNTLAGGDRESTEALVDRLRTDPDHLERKLSDPAVAPVVVTIDQFEEVFTLSEPKDRDALVRSLARLLDVEKGHRVILTVREEFRNRIMGLRPLEGFIGKSWYSMRPLAYDELRSAVEKPAALVNLQFQSGIVDDLVKKVLGQPAALPLLQFTLRALWQNRDRNRITWEVYRQVGDPLDALKASADEFYWGLAQQTRDEARRILLDLVRVDDLLEAYRQPVRKRSLVEAGKANTVEVLELLRENDYVSITHASSDVDAVVEVKHEALIRNWPMFVGWIDEKRVERRQRLALAGAARRWVESGKPVEGLLTGWQLAEASRYEGLSSLELEFVDASRKRQQQQRGVLAVGSVMAFLILALLAGFALFQWIRAEDERQFALTNFLVAEARLRGNDVGELPRSVLLAVEASRRSHSLAAESSLRAGLALLPGHLASSSISAAAIRVTMSPEGSRVAVVHALEEGGLRVRVELWELHENGALVNEVVLPEQDSINAVVFSPDGSILATASANGVTLWEAASGAERSHFGEGNEVLDVAFSGDGRFLATAESGYARVRELATNKLLQIAPEKPVFDVAFHPDGDKVATASWDGVRIWDRTTGRQLRHLASGDSPIPSKDITFSPDGRHLATVGILDDTARVWSWSESREIASVPAPAETVAFSPQGNYVVTAGGASAWLWQTVSGREVYRVALTGRVLAVGFRPRGNVLVTASDDGALDFWDLRRGAGAGLFRTEDFVTGVAFAPSGDLLATSSWDSTVRVWDASSGDEVRILPHDAEVNAVRFSPLGDLLATASRDGAFLWTLDGKRQAHLAEGSSIVKVAFTSDGNQVATASVSGEVIVWTKEGTAIAHLDHESPNDLAFGPGGRYLASCGADGKVKLWDWRAERLVKTWSTGEDSVLAVAFSPEEKYLATGSSKAVEIWDLKMLDRNEPSWNLAQDGPVWDIAYTAEYIIAAGDAGVRVWKTSGGRPVEERSTYRFEDRVVSVDVRRDGHLLLTGSGDVAQLLFLRAEDAIEEACRRLQHNLTRREWQRLIVGEDYRKTCENLPIPEDTASKELVVRR